MVLDLNLDSILVTTSTPYIAINLPRSLIIKNIVIERKCDSLLMASISWQ
jgi:hypothetical protein